MTKPPPLEYKGKVIRDDRAEPERERPSTENSQTIASQCARCVRGCATDEQYTELVDKIADALDAQAAEIALLKEGRKLHDEHADRLEHELAQKDAEIEKWQKLASEGIAIERELRLQALRLGREEMNTLLAQAAAALEHLLYRVPVPAGDEPPWHIEAREALAAIRAKEKP